MRVNVCVCVSVCVWAGVVWLGGFSGCICVHLCHLASCVGASPLALGSWACLFLCSCMASPWWFIFWHHLLPCAEPACRWQITHPQSPLLWFSLLGLQSQTFSVFVFFQSSARHATPFYLFWLIAEAMEMGLVRRGCCWRVISQTVKKCFDTIHVFNQNV